MLQLLQKLNLKKIGFFRRRRTSAKVLIPVSARKEKQYMLHHKIPELVERHNIPHLMKLSTDQKSLKYISVGLLV